MGKNLYFHFHFSFSVEFFEGVSRGGPKRWSMDRSVRWSVDPVRWSSPRTRGQCSRVTLRVKLTFPRSLNAFGFQKQRGVYLNLFIVKSLVSRISKISAIECCSRLF